MRLPYCVVIGFLTPRERIEKVDGRILKSNSARAPTSAEPQS